MIQDLYRFALVLANDSSQATYLVAESVREVLHERGEGSVRRIRWLIFQKIRQKALRRIPGKGAGSLPSLLAALHALPEPSRSAMALLCLGSFSLQDLESFLDLSIRELGQALEIARTDLKRSLPLPPGSVYPQPQP